MAENGKINRLALSQLRLDPLNPRLPEDVQGGDQSALADYISQTYDPLSVASSIAEHGFFESEPLIAVPDGDLFLVVEGNRRLTALLGLTDPELRKHLDTPLAWATAATEAAANGNVPTDVPVLVVSDRKSVAPIIGFRHISGIMPWEPFAKARFIAGMVDDEGLDFAHVGRLVGEKKGDVASTYRNYAILKQAQGEHGLDTVQAEERFGVFTNAMGHRQLRLFIGAPDPGAVQPGASVIAADKTEELNELLVWIFGDEDGAGRVIEDSRETGTLSRVIANPKGLETLRQTQDLAAAVEASTETLGDARRRLMPKLSSARTGLRAAAEVATELESSDPELEALVEDCEEALQELKNVLEL